MYRKESIKAMFCAAMLMTVPLGSATSEEAPDLGELKSQLLLTVAEYEPGTPVTPEIDAKISAAAKALEDAAGLPNLSENVEQLDGTWLSLYDTRNLAYQVNLKFMSGGLYPDTMTPVRMTTQEWRPAEGFYRNIMFMEAGDDKVPFIYTATAGLSISDKEQNLVDVAFQTFEFIPSDARYSADDLRSALGIEPSTPLVVKMPEGVPASNTHVTYLDEDIRINRGTVTPYIAVLKRLK